MEMVQQWQTELIMTSGRTLAGLWFNILRATHPDTIGAVLGEGWYSCQFGRRRCPPADPFNYPIRFCSLTVVFHFVNKEWAVTVRGVFFQITSAFFTLPIPTAGFLWPNQPLSSADVKLELVWDLFCPEFRARCIVF